MNDTTVVNVGQNTDIFDPWGKPGAGAPLRDEQGHVRAAGVYGKHTGEMEKRSAHKKVVVDKAKASEEYGIDVASWLRADTTSNETGQIVAKGSLSDRTAYVSVTHK